MAGSLPPKVIDNSVAALLVHKMSTTALAETLNRVINRVAELPDDAAGELLEFVYMRGVKKIEEELLRRQLTIEWDPDTGDVELQPID